MEQKKRLIDTGLRGATQKDILASVLGQLSDGWWENSSRMDPYWKHAKIVEENGKVYLQVDSYSVYDSMSDAEILQWFGKKIKFLIKNEFEGNKKAWSRTNTKDMTDYLSHKYPSQTTVADCYQTYDILMGRKTANKKYSMQSVYNKLIKEHDVIKEEISDGDFDQAVTRAVYTFGIPDDVDEMDLIGEIEWNLNASDFSSIYDVEEAVTKYLNKRFGHSAYQSVKKPVSKKRVIKEDYQPYTLTKQQIAERVHKEMDNDFDCIHNYHISPEIIVKLADKVVEQLYKHMTFWHGFRSEEDFRECYYDTSAEVINDYRHRGIIESKKINKKKKVIKESLDDYELREAVAATVEKANLPEGLDKKQVTDDICDLIYGKDFDTVEDLEQGVLDYIAKTYGTVEESKKTKVSKRKVIKEDADWKRREQLEKLITSFDQRLIDQKYTVYVQRGDGSYNNPLYLTITRQGVPQTNVVAYTDVEGNTKIQVENDAYEFLRKIMNKLQKAGYQNLHISMS